MGIKDDFEYEGTPKTEIWVSIGAPYCRGGKLNLPSTSDFVRSKNPIKLDDGAYIKVEFASGYGSLCLSTYALSLDPRGVAGVPWYSISAYDQKLKVADQVGGIGLLSGVGPPITIEIESKKEEIYFYATFYDAWGRQSPRTSVGYVKNQFYQKDVFIYLIGGALSVESIEARSGYESPAYAVALLLQSVTLIVPLMLIVPVLGSLVKMVRRREEVT